MPETPQTPAPPELDEAVTENSNAIVVGLLGDEWNLAIVRLAIMAYAGIRTSGTGLASRIRCSPCDCAG